jgi:ribosome biogenesis GTPase / thiamine phosphate phosphatase
MDPDGAPGRSRGLVALAEVGWGDRWAALLGDHASAEGGRVLRHDGVAVTVRTASGDRVVPLRRGLEPVAVGDWLAIRGDQIAAVLERSSLLRRRAAGGEGTQLLAANLDLVLLVCGLDRPVRPGRIQRGEALAWDAGAVPVLVLTKADVAAHAREVVAQVDRDHPGLEVHVTSTADGAGVDALAERLAGATAVLLGESGAGKSSLVNALLGRDAAATGAVRAGDGKGRHTTTSRQLHLLAGGGVLIDTPGIREVGLAGDEDSVETTFGDIDDLAPGCRFNDCAHEGEPGCAVAAAVAAGTLAPERVEAFKVLLREAEAAARRSEEHERRAHERRGTKAGNAVIRSKPGTQAAREPGRGRPPGRG